MSESAGTANQQTVSYQKVRIDFNSSQKLTSILLNGRNYLMRSKAAKVSLKGKGLLGFVTGKKTKPEKEGDELDEWEALDGQTVTLIMNSLEPQLNNQFVYYETAVELWKELENQYLNLKSHSHVYQLKTDITQLNQGGNTVFEYIGQVKAKYQELKTFRPTITDLVQLQEREEQDQVYTFLAGLHPSYEALRAQMLLRTDRISFAEVCSLIQNEKIRRAAMNTADSNPRPENHAFAARFQNPKKGKGGAVGLRCSHCSRDGHAKEGCWILHPHLRPKRKFEAETKKREAEIRKREREGRMHLLRIFSKKGEEMELESESLCPLCRTRVRVRVWI